MTAKKPKSKKPKKAKAKAAATVIDPNEKVAAFDRLAALETERKIAQLDLDRAKEQLKLKRTTYNDLVDQISKTIDEAAHPELFPLYDARAGANGEPDDETWKTIKLAEALPELTPMLIRKMNEGAQLYTMGELVNYTAEDGGRKRLTDLPGVGKAAAGKIEEACMAFWERRAKVRSVVVDVAVSTVEDIGDKAAALVDGDSLDLPL